jgi:uncharacterized protein YdeI (YjbR/CyaY-like superfamily)
VCATRGPEKPPLTRAVDTAPTVEVRSRPDLRGWLAANRSNSPSVWLVSWKKHTPHYLPCGEVVEELLCWGWINSVPRAVEDDRTSILIAPRSPESTWLEVNKDKVAAARASGAMTRRRRAADPHRPGGRDIRAKSASPRSSLRFTPGGARRRFAARMRKAR